MGKADLTPPRSLSAGGSLERDGPGLLMQLWLVLELTLLFVGLLGLGFAASAGYLLRRRWDRPWL